MSTITREFAVEGMHCQGCVKSVTGAVTRLPGVTHVDVSLEKKAATVEFDAAAANPAAHRRRDRGCGLRGAAALSGSMSPATAVCRGAGRVP